LKNETKRRLCLAAILFIALTLRLHAALTANEPPRDDALEYDKLAANISSGRGYIDDDGSPTSFRPPLYPAFLAAIYYVFGHSYPAARVCQAVLGALVVFLIYLIGRDIYPEKAALSAAFMTAIYPSYVILTTYLLSEVLFTFLLAAAVYLLLRLRSAYIKTASLLGAVLGMLSLTRPSAAALPLIFITMFGVVMRGRTKRRLFYLAAALLLFYMMILAPWSVRNAIIHGRFSLISSNGGLNFYQAMNPAKGKIFGLVPDDVVMAMSKGIPNEIDREKFLYAKGVEEVIRQPLRAMRLAFMRALFYWGFFDWEVGKGREYNYLYAFALPFFLWGLFSERRSAERSWVLSAVIAYFFLIIAVSQGVARYRLPTDGFLFLIASSTLFVIFERPRNKVLAVSAVSAYFLINYCAFLKSDYAKVFLKSLMERIGVW
jgi:4-amino-4-deoxy-L-arabinose transferase-like glycosyltransferase